MDTPGGHGLQTPQGLTVALDFDGVIHSYVSGWQGVQPTDDPVKGALEFVEWLVGQHIRVMVFSTRALEPGGAEAIAYYLQAHGFPAMPVVATKPRAHLYIDDRGLRFEGDWQPIKEWIVNNPRMWPWSDYRAHAE